MLAKVCSAAVNGIEAFPVEVEVNAGYGDTKIIIVGLPDAAVRESQDRVSTALGNSGFKVPMGRTTINLAPADVKKEGLSFDLPIAVGMLAASEQIETDQLERIKNDRPRSTGQESWSFLDLIRTRQTQHADRVDPPVGNLPRIPSLIRRSEAPKATKPQSLPFYHQKPRFPSASISENA